MKKLLSVVAAAALISFSAYAEQATVSEIEAGCPASLPIVSTDISDNFGGKVQVLDRSNLSKTCLDEIYRQGGDDKNQGDESDK